MEKRRLIGIFDMLAAFVLEALPFGVKLVLAPSPDETIVSMRSYFSLYPFFYGHIQPLIVALLTSVLLILWLCGMVFEAGEGFFKLVAALSAAAAVICFSQIPMGMSYTAVGAVINLLLAASAALAIYEIRMIRRPNENRN